MNDQDSLDRLPPHNRDAKRSLLSSMLRDNNIVNDIVHLVKAGHFYIYGHQKIYEAITTLNNDDSKPADIVTVAEWLMQEKLIDDVGGPSYLAELWDAAPSAAHYRQYAEIIRQKAMVRNLIHACTEVQRDAYDQSTPPGELLDSAERRIAEVREDGVTAETKHVGETVRETYDALDERRNRRTIGVASGLTDLDAVTGAFRSGQLIVLAARPSVGKTAIAVNMSRHVAVSEKIPMLFVSLEQSRVELTERLLCCQGLIDSQRLQLGQLRADEEKRMFSAGEKLTRSDLYIDEANGKSLLQICAKARRAKRRHGVGLVIIDYLQLILPESTSENREQQVAAMSRRLKLLAQELRIPVIVLAQLNREAEKRSDGRPKLSDLRESGAIEQDADVVILLHRPVDDRGNHDGLIEAIVAKHRNGPTGTALLLYVKQHMRFGNFAVRRAK
jgi:replicative DNA helicase